MPLPKEGQSKEDYIKEFMSDSKMVEDYPDEKQRYAVCLLEWEKNTEMDNTENDSEMFTLDKSIGEIKPTEKEQVIKIFPKGSYYIEKLGRNIEFDDVFFTNIQIAFSAQSLSKPFIDKNHEFKDSFGWPLQLLEKSDGMYAKIKLNKKGVELVKDEEYKYISPAWGKTTDCNGITFDSKLKAVSLTNFPALEGALPELLNQITLSKIDIVSEIKIGGKTDMELEKLVDALTLSKDSTLDVVLEKIELIKKENEDSKVKITELSKTIADINLVSLTKDAVDFITEQIKLGKMHPAIQEMEKEDYILNKEKMIDKYNRIPVPEQNKIDLSKVSVNGSSVSIDGYSPSDEDIVKMEKIGYDPKDAKEVKQFKIHYIDKKKLIGGK